MDVLERELAWGAAVDAAVRDDEIVRAARALDLGLEELRGGLSPIRCAAAIREDLEELRAASGRMDVDRDEVLARADAAVTAYVQAQVRLAIERRIEYAYALSLSVDDTSALDKRRLALCSESQLHETCAGIGGGSVGIVGPSRTGKTALIKRFCVPSAHEDPRLICVYLPSGTPCDKLDFVKHLLARVCREVLDRSGAEQAPSPARQRLLAREKRARARWSTLGATLAWAGTAMAVVGALHVRADAVLVAGIACLVVAAVLSRTAVAAKPTDSAWRIALERSLRKRGRQLPLIVVGAGLITASQSGTSMDPFVVAGAMSLALATAMRGPPERLVRFLSTRRTSRDSTPAIAEDVIEAARDILDELSHETTIVATETRVREGRLGRRLALRSGTRSGFSEQQTPREWTFPYAIDRLQRFVNDEARALTIWIGIDLQRMGKPSSHRFLEEIDPVLRLDRQGCFVLVAMLDDASGASALHVRCDRVVALEPLAFAESCRLLGHDGLGLSMPFVALCHVMSGGIAGSLVEHAQSLVEHNPADRDGRHLSETARALVMRHVKRHADEAYDEALTRCREGSTHVVTWAREVRDRCGSAEELLALHTRRTFVPSGPSPSDHPLGTAAERSDERAIERLADQLAAHCYFAATVLAFFHDGMTREALDRALKGDGPPIEILREARAALLINPSYASMLVRDFRTRCALEPGGHDAIRFE